MGQKSSHNDDPVFDALIHEAPRGLHQNQEERPVPQVASNLQARVPQAARPQPPPRAVTINHPTRAPQPPPQMVNTFPARAPQPPPQMVNTLPTRVPQPPPQVPPSSGEATSRNGGAQTARPERMGGQSQGRDEPARHRGGQQRGRGGQDGAARGRGGQDGAARGRGGQDGAARGRGGQDGAARGRGGQDGTARGRGGQDGAARGRKGQDGAARGREGQDGAARGREGQDGAARGREGQDGAARGREGQDGAARERGGQDSAARGRGRGRKGNRQNWRASGNEPRSAEEQTRNGAQNSGSHNGNEPREDARNNNDRYGTRRWFQDIKQLADSPDDNAVVYVVANPENGFIDFLQRGFDVNTFFCVMQVLTKVIRSSLDENKRRILIEICSADVFLNQFSNQIVTAADECPCKKYCQLISAILLFFQTVARVLPFTACDKLRRNIVSCYNNARGFHEQKNLDSSDLLPFKEVIDDLEVVKTDMVDKEDKEALKRKARSERLQMRPPPEDFRGLSLYPTCEELLVDEVPFLRPNLVEGRYTDVDHYLDVHFRLLREDFVRPLREGISAYVTKDKAKLRQCSVKVTENVRFVRRSDNATSGTWLQFGAANNVKWEYNRRFLFSSLLCFTRDNFKTLLMTTVSNRDVATLKKGELQVEFQQSPREDIFSGSYTMVETGVLFVPYYHVLKTLQSLNEDNFPLMHNIVEMDTTTYLPEYLYVDPPVRYRLPGTNRRVIVENERTWPSPEELSLDQSQFDALFAALRSELVVIQGPPGTGKTFIGHKITEVLVHNRPVTTPILVVCLTNHALDQFLVGVLKYTKKIVRIGGQSKCGELDEFNIRNLRKEITKTKQEARLFYNVKREKQRLENQIVDLQTKMKKLDDGVGVIGFDLLRQVSIDFTDIIQPEEYLPWLLGNHVVPQKEDGNLGNCDFYLLLTDYDVEIEDLEKDLRNPERTMIMGSIQETKTRQNLLRDSRAWVASKLEKKEVPFRLRPISSGRVWGLDLSHRWGYYFRWLQQLQVVWTDQVAELTHELAAKNRELEELQMAGDLKLLQENDVIGLTTTGAARLHGLLRKLGPEIVIVEEAAEVLECHVVACLSEHCKHLVLIGDHKQLRPSVEVYLLVRDFHLDVSLFERLVNNDAEVVTLGVQHRMAPCIAALVSPAIYPDLQNSPGVGDYPEVPGLPKRMFFVNHSELETKTDCDSESRTNPHEAQFVVALCRHLVLQGVSPAHITVLATYRGQMFLIKQEMARQARLRDVTVTVVDNYQGEENRVVLLSLVRSNEQRSIGFLTTENRVCVALSRAKHALYMVGNMACLAGAKVRGGANIWPKIRAALEQQDALGDALPLRCQVHPDERFSVSSARHFEERSPEGGCLRMCTFVLECEHACHQTCHGLNQDHEGVKCLHACERTCEGGHVCPKKCHQPCGDCRVKVEKRFATCGHVSEVPCHVNPTIEPCPRPCDTRLDECGHQCTRKCHVTDDPDHLAFVCKKPCARNNKGCSTGQHSCGRLCHEECLPCAVQVEKKLHCGHSKKTKCSTDPEVVQCSKKCRRELPCGHACSGRCCEPCGPCQVEVTKVIPACLHEARVACSTVPTRALCPAQCERRLRCGHPCQAACAKPCNERCLAEVGAVRMDCGHDVALLCWERAEGAKPPAARCASPCSTTLACDHVCPGTCGTCFQGRFHVACDQPCGRINVCQHSCREPCAKSCPPCREPCAFRCPHSVCRKKCGEPCTACTEACTWRCEHLACTRLCGQPCDRGPCVEPCPKQLACGHACLGFCGEPCPTLCRTCRPDELTEFQLLCNEDEPDASSVNMKKKIESDVFVLLPECGHSIEAEGLAHWMAVESDEVGLKLCPRCKQVIVSAARCGNHVKRAFRDVAKVKQQSFGDRARIEETRKQLEQTLVQLVAKTSARASFPVLHSLLLDLLRLLGATVNGRRNAMNQTSLRAHEIQVSILSQLCAVWDKCGSLPRRNELPTLINHMLDVLQARKHRGSQQLVEDFRLEVLRLQRVAQLLTFRASSTSQMAPLLRQLEATVLGPPCPRYSEAVDREAVEGLCRRLEAMSPRLVPGLGIDELERVQILSALDLQKGRWFTCPNGHPYVITECGGAMEEAACPECGATIGGGNHRLREDNAHFGAMDGSSHPLWSNQTNLENFQFNDD